MTSIRTEVRKIEWNESIKDGKTMAEQNSILMVPANLCVGNNCFSFFAEVYGFYPVHFFFFSISKVR